MPRGVRGHVPNLCFPAWMGLLHRQAASVRSGVVLAADLALSVEAQVRAVTDTELPSLSGVILKKPAFLLPSFLICVLRLTVLFQGEDGRIQ